MKKPGIGTGILVSIFLTVPIIILMFIGDVLFDLAFAPFDLFNWVARVLPGPVITFGIDLMIDTLRFLGINVADAAKTAEQILAVLVFILIGVGIGTVFFIATNQRSNPPGRVDGLIVGALFGFPVIAIGVVEGNSIQPSWVNILWELLLFASWGVTLSWADRRLWEQPAVSSSQEVAVPDEGEVRQVERLNRRQFLVTLGAVSAVITVAGAGLAAILKTTGGGTDQEAQDGTPEHSTGDISTKQLPNQDDPVSPAPGTRPEYTPLKDHYKVFIELEPTVIDGSTWKLPVTGMVSTPLMLSLDDIRQKYQSQDRYITISCISGRVGTSLIGTTQWTGVPVQEVLADAGVQPGAKYLQINSGDGFHESISLELVGSDPRIMFCYAWDGNPLPVEHGYPLRIWIPDRYGMKQPKWITSVEVTDTYMEGYWVERNWDEVAQVKTTSVIDTVAVDAVYDGPNTSLVPVGGIAFSGDRGISKVEVRVDNGPWVEAQLRSPLSETTWVIWRYDWPFEAGDHLFEVRAFEADGTPQIETEAKARPSGSTGIHSVEASL